MAFTVNLRKVIKTKLATYCSDIAYHTSRGNHASIYLVYDLDEFSQDEALTQLQLEVNVMQQGQNTDAVETLADTIWDALDHYEYIDSNFSFSCYQSMRNIIDDDTSLIHRRLVFSIRLFK